jgi:Ca2+-binding RTX toxin-like protein
VRVRRRGTPVPDQTVGIKAIVPDGGGRRTGSTRNDNLLGGRGSDHLDGAGGDDVIWGDSHRPEGGHHATDTLIGGAGKDTIYGARGTNKIDRGPGPDYLQGGAYTNVIRGGDGEDEIRLRDKGAKHRLRRPGSDIVHALTNGRGTIDCGPGNDTVFTGNKRPRVHGCEHVVNQYKIQRHGTHR